MLLIVGQPVCQQCGHADPDLRVVDYDHEPQMAETCDVCGALAVIIPVAYDTVRVWPEAYALASLDVIWHQLPIKTRLSLIRES